MAEFKISKFSSLSFFHNWKTSFQVDEIYIQKFSTSDKIRIQYSAPSWANFSVLLFSLFDNTNTLIESELIGESIYDNIIWNTYNVELPSLEIGQYYIEIKSFTESVDRSFFCVLPDENLSNTTLITYMHRRNEYDTIFIKDEEPIIFQWRVEGGFIPFESSFLVDSEFFRDQRASITQLSAFPYKTQTLTIGAELGVPIWCGEKINLIFSLSNVFIDNISYVRSEGSTPEITEIMPLYPLYIFKIDLENNENYSETLPMPKVKILGTEYNDILGTEKLEGIIN